MIFLTLWNQYSPNQRVLVNPANITYANETIMRVQYVPQRESYPDAKPIGEYPVTIISFAAGLNEESDSIYVLETLDQIYGAIA